MKTKNSALNRGHTDTKKGSSVSKIKIHHERVETSQEIAPPLLSDKYSYVLRYIKAKNYKNVMAGCKTLKKWEEQNKFKFGFIPLGDLQMPTNIDPAPAVKDPIHLHKKLKTSGKLNFVGAQVEVTSQIKPDVWEQLLNTQYWDTQLPLLICHGFPLDFDRNSVLESHDTNHTSAQNFPQDVEAYLEEEIKFGAIVGPF